ncbi:MAG: T9SS type A sorting domain-containing protein [Bacteroidales bacterium]
MESVKECVYNNQFVVHTTYHGGTEYISCPWSYRPDEPHDWDHIDFLAGIYSSTSLYPNMTWGQGNSGMYPINGSTKDSNYGMMGSISWSMEISNDKKPPTSQIMLYYNRNYPAMLAMIEYAGYGLEGVISDANTGDPVQAIVMVNDYIPTFSDPTAGDFHKYVLPGTYSIKVMANGYQTQTIDNVVVSANSSTVTDFQLIAEPGHYVFKFASSQIPDNNDADEGWTPAVLGAPDNVNYSIGKSGWCVLDMQTPVIDGPGFDLIVYEGDSSPESFTCFAGETMDGPWLSLGQGTGTTEFDLSNGPITDAQFIKIVDDGDGTAIGNNAGFDLDAIEAYEPVSGIYIALDNYEIDDSNGNNNGRFDPGETVDIIVNIKNNGNLTANNINGLISTSSIYVTIDIGTANFGNLGQGQSAEGTFTITANASTPEGEPVFLNLLVEASGGSYTNAFILGFSVGLIVEDWETGGFGQFDWETGGNAEWAISSQSPYEGSYCVKSGIIDDDETVWLSITYNVLANGEIGFYKKVSSENGYDYLKFYIDGTMMDQWSGTVPWSESTYPVASGNHTFAWKYEKDQGVASGSDCAWLDYITLPSGALTSVYAGFTSDITEVCEDETVHFTDISSGNIISWNWTFEGGTPGTSTMQNPTVAYSNTGTFDVSLTVSDGTVSHTATIANYISASNGPGTPDQPTGPVWAISHPGNTSNYATNPVAGADEYDWIIEPEEAGELIETETSCTVDWTDEWEGIALIKVKSINECGESNYSEGISVSVITTRINQIEENDIHVFPNPSTGNFVIDLGASYSRIEKVEILNNLGKIIFLQTDSVASEKGLINIQLEDLDPGVYFVRISGKEIYHSQKIILK